PFGTALGAPRRRPAEAPTGSGRAGDGHGFGADVIDHGLQVAGPPVHLELAVGTGPLGQDGVDVFARLPGAQIVDHVVDELQELHGEVPVRHFGLLAEVDQLSVDAVWHVPAVVVRHQLRQVLGCSEVVL